MYNAIIHLRLKFSLVLTPLFLLGVYLTERPLAPEDLPRLAAAYLIIHILLYGGMNAYNSCYDRDAGPIGALESPPPVDRTVLFTALLCKAAAILLGFQTISRPFGALVAAAVILSALYSHPATRFKERPVLAALTILFGQGALGVLWGWTAAATTPVTSLPATAPQIAGLAGAALLTLGFYPLTGVYQIDQDARRGQTTLAVWLTRNGCFLLAAILSAIGGSLIAASFILKQEWAPLAAIALYTLYASIRTIRWYYAYHPHSALENQRHLMQLAYANGAAFSTLFSYLLLRSILHNVKHLAGL